ncbi:MAG: hypothetical protein ACRDD2_01445 [Sarcina sp.]
MKISKIKSFFSNQFSITFIILILLLLILIIRQNIVSSDFKELINFSNEIKELNSYDIKNNKLSTEDFTKTLNNSIPNLKTVETNLNKLEVSDKYTNHKRVLLTALEKNIFIQEELKSLLENPSKENLSVKTKAIISEKNQLVSLYKQCSELSLSASINDEDNSIIYLSLNYINELLKLNRDSDILNNQLATYLTEVENLFNEFSAINEDIFPIIDLMKSEGRSLTPLLDDINKKIEIFKNLEDKLYSLSVPIECMDSFNSLKEVFVKYNLFINNSRNYLLKELNSGADANLLTDCINEFNELNQLIENFKSTLATLSIN